MIERDKIAEIFEKYSEDFNKFSELPKERQYCRRKDLCAFMIIGFLLPSDTEQIVAAAEHDQIWLGVDLKDLCEVAMFHDIQDLCRCGVWLDKWVDSLSMFV